MKIEIFGVKFDNLDIKEAVEKIHGFVVLPYSEFIVRAQKDEKFREILNSADFCLCEGKGLYLAARLMGVKLKKNISGVDLIYKILNTKHNLQKIFLFGATRGVIEKTAKKLGENVIGFEHGYQDYESVIRKINLLKPDILLVGLGSPKQEEFIYENLNKMPSVKLAIGVGGAFDFISGQIKRAPKTFQILGLEWLWRLIMQPKRIKRIFIGVCGLICLTLKYMLSLKNKG